MTGFVALGALDKGGVGRSVDEGSGKRVTLRSSILMVPRRTNRQRGKGRRIRRRREEKRERSGYGGRKIVCEGVGPVRSKKH